MSRDDEFVDVRIKMKHFAVLAECEEVTGRKIQELIDEGVGEYVEATVSAYMEEAAGRAGSA